MLVELEVCGILVSDIFLFNMVVVLENGIDYDFFIDD